MSVRLLSLLIASALLLVACPDDDDDSGDDDDSTSDDDDSTSDDDDSASDDDDSTSDDDDVTSDDDDATPVSIVTNWTFAPSEAGFDNPERGFYSSTSLVEGGWFPEGFTLAFSYIRLDDYREADIPQSLLDDVQAGFDAAREAGVKIVLRVAYNIGPWPETEPDAPLAWVLVHIGQLTPLIEANADVIAVVQAGFIGAWGEWHSSTNGLEDSKAEILDAVLDAVPADRMVQVRTPVHKNDVYGNVPFDAADAFSGLDHARVGHYNDCFLASDDDFGTYPWDAVEEWKGYVAAETLYTPMGGETCNPNPPRSECASALAELEQLHYSYLHIGWHPDVLTSWEEGGCMPEIERRLGYRLVLTGGSVTAGVSADVSLTVTNEGWACRASIPRPRGAGAHRARCKTGWRSSQR